MLGDKIRKLRMSRNLTQSAVARKLRITRASVNAWEMGVSAPSTKYVAELAILFGVSSDYLLGIPQNQSINVGGLSEKEVAAVKEIVNCLKNR